MVTVLGEFRDVTPEDFNRVHDVVFHGTANPQQLIFRPVPGLGRAETPVTGLYLGSPRPILVPESMESLRCERGPCCARSRAPSRPDPHPGQKINPRSNPQRSET